MSKKKTITIKIEQRKIAIGHTEHTTGSGAHKDKRKKREGTRSQRTKRAIKDQE